MAQKSRHRPGRCAPVLFGVCKRERRVSLIKLNLKKKVSNEQRDKNENLVEVFGTDDQTKICIEVCLKKEELFYFFAF